ncbi:MAG: alpha/beta hydrolase, partial [Solirubrobacterales bacterium]
MSAEISANPEEVWFDSQGIQLHGRLRAVGPNRPTLVLLCGLGFHTFEYEPFATRLAQLGFNTLSFDYRGHGRTAGPRGMWTIDELVADTTAAIDLLAQRGMADLSLFGNSLGAMVAIEAGAGDRRVRTVLASNAPAHVADFLLTRPRRALWAMAKAASALPLKISVNHFYSYRQLIKDPVWIQRIQTDPLISAARRLSVRTYRSLLDEWDGEVAIAKLDCPVLVLRGANDELQPPEQTELLFSAASEPKGLLAVDGGHLPHLDSTAELAEE